LVVHYLCKTWLCHTSNQKFTPSQLKHFAEVASEQEIQADQSERDIEMVYSLALMREKEGELYEGMVISVNSRGLIVQLEEIPVTGVIKEISLGEGNWEYLEREMRYINRRTHKYYQLMDTLTVIIGYVEDDIYLFPIPETLRHNVSKTKSSLSHKSASQKPKPSGRMKSPSSKRTGRTKSPSSKSYKSSTTRGNK